MIQGRGNKIWHQQYFRLETEVTGLKQKFLERTGCCRNVGSKKDMSNVVPLVLKIGGRDRIKGKR